MKVDEALIQAEVERLRRMLGEAGVPVGEWEKFNSGTKKLYDLALETLLDGVIVKRSIMTGRYAAFRDRAFVLAVFTDEDGEEYIVQEKHRLLLSTIVTRTFSTSEELARGFVEPSFSETRCKGLSIRDAAKQGLMQEVQIANPDDARLTVLNRVRRRRRPLASYPGLDGIERCYDVRYDLVKDECRRLWVEREGRVRTMCGWRDDKIPPHVRNQPLPADLRLSPKPKPQKLLVS